MTERQFKSRMIDVQSLMGNLNVKIMRGALNGGMTTTEKNTCHIILNDIHKLVDLMPTTIEIKKSKIIGVKPK